MPPSCTEVVIVSQDDRTLGQRGEDAAVAYLERYGMTVAERNWRCKSGEVDIVALDESTVVFCEVKTRRSVRKGSAEDSVTLRKQATYRRIAAAYLAQNDLTDVSVRFDVVTILVIAEDRALLRHHRAAFTDGGS